MKDRPLREKITYFLDYYKWPAAGIFLAILFLISMVHSFLTRKTTVFTAELLNASARDSETTVDSMEAELSRIMKTGAKEDVSLDASQNLNLKNSDELSMAVSERIFVMISANELDVLVSDPDVFSYYADAGAFTDLSTLLDQEVLEKLKQNGEIYYIERVSMDNMESSSQETPAPPEPRETGSDNVLGSEFLQGNGGSYLQPRDQFVLPDPNSMDAPVPVGILMTNSKLTKAGFYSNTVPIAGVIVNSEHADRSVQFLEWAIKD